MTSTLAPFGLRAARKIGGNANSTGLNTYSIDPNGALAIFSGDPVKVLVGYVTLAATADYMQGVFMGCTYNDPVSKQPRWSPYYPANTSVGTDPYGIQALVLDDPNATFLIQANASVSAGDVGLNFEVSGTGGSTYTGNSNMYLKASSRTAGTAMLRLLGVFQTPDNTLSGADPYPIVEVKIVQSQINRVSAV